MLSGTPNPDEDRALYLEQLRLSLKRVLVPELSSPRALDTAALCDRLLGGLAAEERARQGPSRHFGEVLWDLVHPEAPGGASLLGETDLLVLRQEGAELVRRAGESGDGGLGQRAAAVLGAEAQLLEALEALRAEALADPAGPAPDDEACSVTPGQVTALLRRRFGGSARLSVQALSLVPGGRSKETILVTLRGSDELPPEVVLRKDRPVGLLPTRALDEFAVLEAVHAFGGIPVPQPFFAGEGEEEGLGLGSFLVMERAPGRRAGEFFPELGAPRRHGEALGRQLAAALARLHALPLERLQGSALGRPEPLTEASLVAMVDGMAGRIREASGTPWATAEAAVQWLHEHVGDVVPASRLCLLQGDFGFHNLLVDGDRLTALVDWEGATIGPPAREMAAAWPVASSLTGWPGFVQAYLEAGGQPEDVEPRAVAYYRLFMALGGYMTSRTGGHLFRTGVKRDLLTAHSGLDSQFRCARNLARALGDATAAP